MNNTTDSQIFSGARFLATLRRDWVMERSGWCWRILAMFGFLFVVLMGTNWLTQKICEEGEMGMALGLAQEIAAAFVCFCCMSIFAMLGASHFYAGYSSPGSRLNQLMTPASTLEKYLSRFLICIVGVPLAFMLCWELADWANVWISRVVYGDNAGGHVGVVRAYEMVSDKMNAVTFSALGIVLTQGIYLLGSTIWPKYSLIKTMGAVCVIEFIYGMAAGYTFSLFLDAESLRPHKELEMHVLMGDAFLILMCVCTVFCFVTAYFRMREDEIIQRM